MGHSTQIAKPMMTNSATAIPTICNRSLRDGGGACSDRSAAARSISRMRVYRLLSVEGSSATVGEEDFSGVSRPPPSSVRIVASSAGLPSSGG